MSTLLDQLSAREAQLKLQEDDGSSPIGSTDWSGWIEEIESHASALGGKLLFVPDEKLDVVLALLGENELGAEFISGLDPSNPPEVNDPWRGLLGDCE